MYWKVEKRDGKSKKKKTEEIIDTCKVAGISKFSAISID